MKFLIRFFFLDLCRIKKKGYFFTAFVICDPVNVINPLIVSFLFLFLFFLKKNACISTVDTYCVIGNESVLAIITVSINIYKKKDNIFFLL